MLDLNEWFQSGFLNGIVMFGLLLLGLFLTIRSRLYPIRRLPFIFRHTVADLFRKDTTGSNRSISPFQAVTTALAGTMGVGNIAGVATALVTGGPGSIVWMWISAFLGMMTKYTEIFLAVKHRRRDGNGGYYGGPMYYMQDAAGNRVLASLFAVLCACCSFGIGNMAQVNSISTAMESAFQVPAWMTAVAVTAIVALVIFGGIQRIAHVTEWIIPFISILYLCCSGAFLWLHRGQIADTFTLMLQEAFSPHTAAGGVAGYGVSRAMSMGLSRGVFTNEAGLGSAPIAHASADCKSPEHQGVWGIFEVFLDTILMCTITALVILIAENGTLWQSGLDGAPLTSAAFASTFHGFGSGFIAISIAFYAISAMLGWCFYGESALKYLAYGNQKLIAPYRVLFLLCIVMGVVAELHIVWRIADYLNALMAIPNIIAILLLRKDAALSRPARRSTRYSQRT